MTAVTKLGEIKDMVSPKNASRILGVKNPDYAIRIMSGQTIRGGTNAQNEAAKKLLKKIIIVALEEIA